MMESLKLCAVKDYFPFGIAELICEFAKPTPAPYDSWALWAFVPEFDCNGNYGHLPMSPIDLPLFS
jgi:hypothetical protein